MPDRFGVPVVTCLRAFLVARKAAGATDAPAFPAPSEFRGHVAEQLGRFRTAGTLNHVSSYHAPRKRGIPVFQRRLGLITAFSGILGCPVESGNDSIRAV